MKKSLTLFVSMFLLSLPSAAALAQATADSVGGANPRPQSVGGANPRPTGTLTTSQTITTVLVVLSTL